MRECSGDVWEQIPHVAEMSFSKQAQEDAMLTKSPLRVESHHGAYRTHTEL